MIELKLPSLGEGVEKGTVVAILVKAGDKVVLEQPLIEVETDKVTVEVPSEQEGVIKAVLVKVGEEVPEGTPIVQIEPLGKSPSFEDAREVTKESSVDEEIPTSAILEEPSAIVATTQEIINNPVPIAQVRSNGGLRASPLARKVASEIGVDISAITSGQSSGRISVKDVKNYAKRLNESRSQDINITTEVTLPDFNQWGTTRRVQMTGIDQATSKNMSQSWNQIPHAWLQEKADITDLEKARKHNKTRVKEGGGSLTITCILVMAMARVLKKFPLFNTSIDNQSKELIYKDYINIGVAVDTDKGLVVPVIKNADQKSLTEIAQLLSELSEKARAKKLTREDLVGGTFTISNLGGIGTTGIFPIVNFPQVGILGIAASSIEGIWKDDSFVPRLLMPMTIGFDHRVINGADAARFLKYLKDILEDWFVLSL